MGYYLHNIYLLPTTYHLPPTTYYLLPTTYYLPPTTYYLLPTTYHLPPTTYQTIKNHSMDIHNNTTKPILIDSKNTLSLRLTPTTTADISNPPHNTQYYKHYSPQQRPPLPDSDTTDTTVATYATSTGPRWLC